MIRDAALAGKISDLMLEYSARLDQSVADVADVSSIEELNQYRRGVGAVMGEMLLRIMNPLYRMHPDIKPKALD